MESENLKQYKDKKLMALTGYQGYIVERLVDIVYELELKINKLEEKVEELSSELGIYTSLK